MIWAWLARIGAKVWGWIAVAAGIALGVLAIRGDARRDQRRETDRRNTERELEAVRDASEARDDVRRADPDRRDRLRRKWERPGP